MPSIEKPEGTKGQAVGGPGASPKLSLEVQQASRADWTPSRVELRRWALAALASHRAEVELVIRIVDEAESQALNRSYRGKDRPTNVLSFPFEAPPGIGSRHLGDIVVCAAVVEREALEQGKPLAAHWAHMIVHGVLHLLGYDHEDDREAEVMESLEIRILAGLGLPDPYEENIA